MNGYLIAAYAVLWVGLLAYIGWVALRMRGVKGEVETLRELLDERDRAARARAAKRAQAAKLATQAAPQPTAQAGKAAQQSGQSASAPGSFKPTRTGNSKPAARKK